jgi:hypothetical protein
MTANNHPSECACHYCAALKWVERDNRQSSQKALLEVISCICVGILIALIICALQVFS